MNETEPTDKYLAVLKEKAIQDCTIEVKQRVIYKFWGLVVAVSAFGYITFSLLVNLAVNTQIYPLVTHIQEKRGKLEYIVSDSNQLIEKIDDTESKIGKLYRDIEQISKTYEKVAVNYEALQKKYNQLEAKYKSHIVNLENKNQQLREQLKQQRLNAAFNTQINIQERELKLRIAIPIDGQVNTPLANQIQQLLATYQGYIVGDPSYEGSGLNHTDSVIIFYNQRGCEKIQEIEESLKTIKGLQVYVSERAVDMKSTDIAITFQNENQTMPKSKPTPEHYLCEPDQPE